ncbi:MAG: S8 family peptidase [Bacteroidota bacterium]
MVSTTFVKAQETSSEIHYYYIEEASYDLLKPINVITKADKTLELEFSSQSLTDFFATMDIHLFNREFEWSRSTYFHKYYLIGLESDDQASILESINGIVSAEYIGDLEYDSFDTPDDYFDHGLIQNRWVNDYPGNQNVNISQDKKAYEHLELVKARRAWNITKGSSNIAVGVVDDPFYLNHPDLQNKITQHYGANWSGNGDRQHGTRVAGVVAADTDNGEGISAIGYDTNLITASKSLGQMPQGIISPHALSLYLVEQHSELKVLNFSWGGSYESAIAEEVYDSIVEHHNVTLVAAAGNSPWQSSGPSSSKYYPATYDNVISVSSVSSYNGYGQMDENGQQWGWKDVHDFFIGDTLTNHQHHDKVDLVAPGYLVPSPNRFDEYMFSTGTSFASPMVAGTVALMYDVNPDITPAQVKTILKETADDIYHIPENQQYDGLLGDGRLNAYAAVLQAKCLADPEPGLDLMMQNSDIDYGEQPDTDTEVIWNSPDIWVRNQPDGHLYKESEDLQYQDSNSTAYVYIRITNNSCEVSSGAELLKLYWAKGGLSQTWPAVWEGDTNTGLLDFGGSIDTQNIPSLEPGESTILEFEWQPKNPEMYEFFNFEKPWMFCFLARIVTDDDPMTSPEGENAATNTRNNNNIAYKNETVINVGERPNKGSIVVGNLGGQVSLVSNVEFFTNTNDDDNLWADAEVRAELNEDLWQLWQNSGAQSTSVRVVNQNTREIILLDNGASLDNILFPSDEWGVATMSVNFLINEVDAQEEYTFHVQQCDASSQETLGGFSYTFLRDNQRQLFSANYNSESNTDNTETLHAENINEDALYNWYDEDENLVYSGSDFTTSSVVAKKYKLEVVAEEDGHKDYKEVETKDKRGLSSVSPNPANTTIEVGYLIAEEDNAYIMITNSATGSNHNYVINNEADSVSISVEHLQIGSYVVNLVIDGVIIDAKHLLIN